MKKFFKFLLGFIFTIIIVSAAAIYFLYPKMDEAAINNLFKGQDKINILLIGKESPVTLDTPDPNAPAHSDTLMLATINKATNKMQVVSIPRDTYFEYLPGSKKRHQKINAAFFINGAEGTIAAIEKFLDTKIDKYIVVDYNTVIQTIDAVGGMDIDWEYDDYYYTDEWVNPPLVIDLKHGPNHLDGQAALNYLRTRKIYKNQDIDRIKAQQNFMAELFQKVKNPKNVVLIPKFLKIIAENTQTNMTRNEILSLGFYGVKNIKKDEINFKTLPGDEYKPGKISFYKIDQDVARKVFSEDYEK
ncbi:LCP family protein [Peptoniphilus mikwangii]|uniref:LCP family protein n=1 Tax=Peptoniphilus mikwangii TaxID=1354300 RepID=UPI0004092FB5|nr:LCP family protein [Peptoniphilus mikwangii]